MEINDIEKLIQLIGKSNIVQFKLEKDGTKISIEREAPSASLKSVHSVNTYNAVDIGVEPIQGKENKAHFEISSKKVEQSESEQGVIIKSPIVGTFYRKPSPDADFFVKEGDRVSKGDTLCIVEAMKLMNEIESTVSGTVKKVYLQDGQVAEYGESLFLILPDA
jgi:acetyl-CoA carboxylase biotin carboxyl carrier protein